MALHDREAELIQFAYYSEDGEHPPQAPLKFGEGLTSRILRAREPLLLNQDAQFEALGTRGVGTLASSYLGVPITVEGLKSVEQAENDGPKVADWRSVPPARGAAAGAGAVCEDERVDGHGRARAINGAADSEPQHADQPDPDLQLV